MWTLSFFFVFVFRFWFSHELQRTASKATTLFNLPPSMFLEIEKCLYCLEFFFNGGKSLLFFLNFPLLLPFPFFFCCCCFLRHPGAPARTPPNYPSQRGHSATPPPQSPSSFCCSSVGVGDPKQKAASVWNGLGSPHFPRRRRAKWKMTTVAQRRQTTMRPPTSPQPRRRTRRRRQDPPSPAAAAGRYGTAAAAPALRPLASHVGSCVPSQRTKTPRYTPPATPTTTTTMQILPSSLCFAAPPTRPPQDSAGHSGSHTAATAVQSSPRYSPASTTASRSD